MIQNRISTQTSLESHRVGDMQSNENEMDGEHSNTMNGNGNENGNSNGHDNDNHKYTDEGEKVAETQTKTSGISHAPFSSFEFVFVSIYKLVGIGLHIGLAIAILAIVVVVTLGSFHDQYFVTLLHRARRTDALLRNEITYYERKCDITDVTISDAHHIHFGDVSDQASEIFIDIEKIQKEMGDVEEETVPRYDEHGLKIVYQDYDKIKRRRRRFKPKFNIWEFPKLRPIPKKVAEKAGNLAVDTMMTHGSVMIPQMLSEATTIALREFVIKKNERVLGTPDQYPMSASHNRISYGIESTEHPAVVRALREIHDHGVFAHLIKNLVNDDNPALSEITAITAWAGAHDQNWHADIKHDGNPVKFGRTFSHSYSLFVPLQDTTASMGATDLCPGTHMCTSEDLFEVCEKSGINLSQVRKPRPRHEYGSDEFGKIQYEEDLQKNGIWRAGDGALLNQHGWHRGPGHKDEDMDDRIVFIVSFLKRPSADDPRQLSRGTYFHQKWLNWGSTWEDMVDTMANLQRPWNILRCLHLWKPSDRSWGYDLFTATTLRIANNQMGGEPDDLDGIIDNVINPINYPKWLQGDIDYDSENCWSLYLSGTIRKTYFFLKDVNFYGLIGLVTFLATSSALGYLYNMLLSKLTANRFGQRAVVGPVLKSGVKRLLFTHLSILALGLYVWHVKIRSSQWAIDIDSGKSYMRPFPTKPIFRDEDPGVLGRNTTLPRRSDVLIGTRLNTKTIGAYKTWYDYHPGNRVFDQFVDAYGGDFYQSLLPKDFKNQTFSELPSGLSNSLVDSTFDFITKHHGGGRFLMQDYRSGDWMVLDESESLDYIKKRLLIGSKHTRALGAIQEEIHFLLDKQRFGFMRKALSMSWISQLHLFALSKEIFSTPFERVARKVRKVKTVSSAPFPSASIILPQSGYRLPKWKPIGPTVSSTKDENGNRRFLIGTHRLAFRPGMEIYLVSKVEDEDEEVDIFQGTIIDLNYNKRFRDRQVRFQVSLLEDGIDELGEVEIKNVPRKLLRPRSPISSGSRVSMDFDDVLYDGTILLVMADGSADVMFDDGDLRYGLEYGDYTMLDLFEK